MAATIVAQSAIVAKAAAPAQRQTSFTGLARISLVPQAAPALPAVQNGSKTRQMLVWQPKDNKYFETFSYLPPLTSDQIAKQVDYMVGNGWIPTLEFANAEYAYVSNENTVRMGNCASNYYDNRYWTMYKLPMFGCTDAQQVLTEIANCEKTFPDAYIRLVAFDSVRQVQITGLLVHRPPSASDWRQPKDRSV